MILRLADGHLGTVRRLTEPSFVSGLEFPPETGCILLLSGDLERPPLLVREVFPPEAGDLCETSTDGLTFSRGYLRRALLAVRERRLSGFITVHTHPLSTTHVDFSPYDDQNDPELMANLQELEPGAVFGSMVLGSSSAKARVWRHRERRFQNLARLGVVGEGLQFLASETKTDKVSQTVGLFDRGVELTGDGALIDFTNMKIAVAGAGGTGSLMVELLARAGAGEIVVFDFDGAEVSNLNRVLHLRTVDVEAGIGKADRLRDAIAELGLPSRVSLSEGGGDVRDDSTARELASCDLIVGCVDRDWPRLILSELAYRFLIPFVDLGTEISTHNGEISSMDARVSISGPGRPCLLCSGVISPDRVRLEGLANAEQERQLAMGYSADIHLRAPAVMDLNMRAASMAMLIVRHLLQPFLEAPLAHAYRETVTSFHVRQRRFESLPGCVVCQPGCLASGGQLPLTARTQDKGARSGRG